jgi:hypothetical protein
MTYNIHPLALAEYVGTVRYMQANFYDSRTVRNFIDRIETAFIEIANVPRRYPPDSRGYHPSMLSCGPIYPLGFRIYYYPDFRGLPYIMGVCSPSRKPGYIARRKPGV